MSYNFLSMVQRKYKRFGINIPTVGFFVPGKNCGGKEPLITSDECFSICFGTHGAHSTGGLPLPCKAMAAVNKQSIKKSLQASGLK